MTTSPATLCRDADITERDVALLRSFAALLAGTFFATTAVVQPGVFGTLGLFVLFGTIFVIGTGCAFALKCQPDHSRHSYLR
jgi:hypothetical protein